MSEENVRIVEQLGEAYLRGDVAAMLEFVHPDVIVTQFAEQPDTRPYHGHDQMLQALAEWVDTWDDYAIEPRDAQDFGDKVLVSLHQRGRGKASGVEFDEDVFFVYTLRDGKVVRWEMFPSERDAVEAAERAG